MLFYFTGTGNSLYVAKRLERQPISIPQVMHREDLIFSDDRIGIVAPIYGHEVPAMVQEFLEKATFQTPYFYMILTYGNRHGGAAELAQELCARCGICQRVSPSASIRLVEDRAEHVPGRCQTCLACAHACPRKAVQLTVPEKNPSARYRNPHVTLRELIQANQQPGCAGSAETEGGRV